MTQQNRDGLDQVRKWLVPLLIAAVGFLASLQFNDIRTNQTNLLKKVDDLTIAITQRQTEVAKDMQYMQNNISKNSERITKVEESCSKNRSDLESFFKSLNDTKMYGGYNLYKEAEKRLRLKY